MEDPRDPAPALPDDARPASDPQGAPRPHDPRDEDGLPLDREPTIDDVRGRENHFKLAVGCSSAVVLLILAFWVLRVVLAR